jgi:hypothetical protein
MVLVSTGGVQQGFITMRVATGSVWCVVRGLTKVEAVCTTLGAALVLPCTLIFLVAVVALAFVILGAVVKSGLLSHA